LCFALAVAVVVPALIALTLVAGVWVALHAYEIIWWREARASGDDRFVKLHGSGGD
jgi:hypothetical protein